MIEEIKMILDAVDGVADLGLWALLGFVVYKLVIYMSTTGAIVFCVKLIVEKLHDAVTRERTKIVKADLDGVLFLQSLQPQLVASLQKITHRAGRRDRGGRWCHEVDRDDLNWLADAVKEKIERERQS